MADGIYRKRPQRNLVNYVNTALDKIQGQYKMCLVYLISAFFSNAFLAIIGRTPSSAHSSQ